MTDDDYNNTVWELLKSDDTSFSDKEIGFLTEMSTRGIYTPNQQKYIDILYERELGL